MRSMFPIGVPIGLALVVLVASACSSGETEPTFGPALWSFFEAHPKP